MAVMVYPSEENNVWIIVIPAIISFRFDADKGHAAVEQKPLTKIY